jgi:hypothetical protein
MSQPNHSSACAIYPRVDNVKKRILPIVYKSPDCIRTYICHLHHTGKFAIHKERGFHDPVNLPHMGAGLMKFSHELSQLARHRWVVILNKQSYVVIISMWGCLVL